LLPAQVYAHQLFQGLNCSFAQPFLAGYEAVLCKLLIDSRNEIILWHCLFFNGLISFGFATSGFTL
jgi:hypothetical protein